MSTVAFAEQTAGGDNGTGADNGIYTLEQVTVVGQSSDQLTGSNVLDREQLEKLPAKNGSINEAIGILPGVQLPEQARTSIKGGEILPPNVSISGGAVYQNNFTIDGFSNNSLLDPMNNDPSGAQFVPGHPQAIFLPVSLLEELTVYRYNIPASYGSFTGGVVDASIQKPTSEFWGEVSYRTTRDSWTVFHIDQDISDDFEDPIDFSYQPRFKKQEASFSLNTPITQRINFLTAYSINHSEIPINNFNSSKNQIRRNENFLAKISLDIDNKTSLYGTLQYSPYQGDYFNGLAKNSDFTIEGGGWQASLTYELERDAGQFKIMGALKGSRNNRSAPNNLFGWLAYVDGDESSKPWGIDVGTSFRNEIISREGSVGSLESNQNSVEIKADFLSKPILSKDTNHTINAGINFEFIRGKLERAEEHNQYYLHKPPSLNENLYIVCGESDPACIYKEQFFLDRSHFPAGTTAVDMTLVDLYIDDTITWQNLELRPGLRISYDNYMSNTNTAPRLAASYDFFGNGNTILIGGWNRYYGKTLLTYKLREASPGVDTQQREVTCEDGVNGTVCTASSWPEYERPTTIYRYSQAETPYSDETVLGLDQNLMDGRLKITWVQRKGRDEFTRERTDQDSDGQRYYQLTNNGESEHDEYTVDWERQWENHYLAVNATYQETTQSNESYTDNFYGDLYLEDKVLYKGETILRADLPRLDFNRPWKANLIYSANLPMGVTFTNVTRFRSGYKGLGSYKLSTEERGVYGVRTGYKNVHYPSAVTFDWKIDWELPIPIGDHFVATLEINNVFNKKVQIGNGDLFDSNDPKDYELGRQFWLGMTYKF